MFAWPLTNLYALLRIIKSVFEAIRVILQGVPLPRSNSLGVPDE